MKKNLQKAISGWITAAIVLTIGILCIIAENASGNTAGNAYQSISYVIGITFIVVSVIGLICKAILSLRTVTKDTISDGILLATGIYFVVNTALGGTILGILVDYIPYILVVLGGLFLIDSILLIVNGLLAKAEMKPYVIAFSVEFFIAAIAVTLGVLALPAVDIISAKFTILGVILIIYALYKALSSVVLIVDKKNNTPTEPVDVIPDDEVVGQA